MPARGRRLPDTPERMAYPASKGEGGRGLFLVAALSERRDWYLTQEPAGKVVSCELEAGQPELPEVGGGPASQPLLPRRIPRQVLVRPVMSDPDIFCAGFGMDSAI